MKRLLCAAAFGLSASAAMAGGYDDGPIVPIDVIVDETTASAGAYDFVPFAVFALLVAVASSSN